jgi:hypothetical protein
MRNDWLILIILLISCGIIFLLYHDSISPSIAGGDSGEIVAEGCQLGTAHPPGYPLITMLIYFISKLATETHSVAFLVNVSSSFFTSMAAFLMGLVVYEYSDGAFAGSVLAGGLFAFSPLIWQYAITAEVFPLNTCLAALIVYLTVKFSKTGSTKVGMLGAFVCGVALCNQHTIILFEAPLVLWMLILLRKRIYYFPQLFLHLSLAFTAGFSGYLYLPISAIFNHRPGSWGYVATISGFIHHFLRKDYGTFQLFSGKTGRENEKLVGRNSAYWKDLSEVQTQGIVVYLLFIGIIISIIIAWKYDHSYESVADSVPTDLISKHSSASKQQILASINNTKKNNKKNKTIQTAVTEVSVSVDESSTKEMVLVDPNECRWTPFILFLTQIFYLCVFHSLSNLPLSDKLLYGVHQRFWMQPNILIFIWIGIGFNSIYFFLQNFVFGSQKQNEDRSSTKTFILGFIQILFLGAAFYLTREQYSMNYDFSNQKNATYFRDYARAILGPLPKNSILLINYDQQWTSTRYLQVCEGYRPDVITIQLSMMSYQWFKNKRSLYQNLPVYSETNEIIPNKKRKIKFPGTYLTYENSPFILKENAFTLIQFLNENYFENNEKNIFIGGKLGTFDININKFYDIIPYGIVSKFIPLQLVSSEIQPSSYAKDTVRIWDTILSHFQNKSFPPINETKYPEETWEWTINRDLKDRLTDLSSYLLSIAVQRANEDVVPLIDATYYIESTYYLEGNASTPSSLLKNLGLAHLHLVQNKILNDSILPKPSRDFFNTLEAIQWPEVK